VGEKQFKEKKESKHKPMQLRTQGVKLEENRNIGVGEGKRRREVRL
jgi:hypothetical protein